MTIASPPDLEHLHHLAIVARDGLQAFGIVVDVGPHVPVHHQHLLQLLDAVDPERIAAANERHRQLPHGWLDELSKAAGRLNTALARASIDEARSAGRDIARLTSTARDHLKEHHAA